MFKNDEIDNLGDKIPPSVKTLASAFFRSSLVGADIGQIISISTIAIYIPLEQHLQGLVFG